MSNLQNDELLDRASQMVGYWEGNKLASDILEALNSGDLEAVRVATVIAEASAARQEIYGYGLLPDNGVY